MQYFTTISHKRYRFFLGAIALAGFVFVVATTSQYGAGVSSDAVRILSTADNLAEGRGFFDMVGSPLLWWPPLYPLLLAGIKILTGLGVFEIAWYLNVILYPLNLWIWGELLYHIFEEKPVYAVLSTILMVLSRSTLRVYANVFSEPIFITFFLVFFLAAASYFEKTSYRALWLMTVAAGLGFFLRYVGIVLTTVLGILILYREGPRALARACAFCALTILPTGAWVYFHNYLHYGLLFGPRVVSQFLPFENVSLTLTKMFNWFIPLHPLLKPLLMHPWIILLTLFLLLLIINDRKKWSEWSWAILKNRYLAPSLLFAILYLILMTFTVNTIDHRDLTSDRYYVIILPVTLAILFTTLDLLVFNHLDLQSRRAQTTLAVVFAISLVYPVFSVQEYLRKALVQGEPSNYNIDNTAALANLQLFKVAHRIMDDDPSALLGSNYAPIAWFQFQRPMVTMPFQDTSLSQEQKLAALMEDYSWWPGDAPVYVIWFTPNEYVNYAPPENLKVIVDIELLYQNETGQIFYAKREK